MTQGAADDGHPAYRIGAVARLTGLSTHTLRKWEVRYRLVAPRRSAGGERVYSAADVRRLGLVRDLAGAGMPLGQLAGHDTAALERLLAETVDDGAQPVRGPAAAVGVAVLGDALAARLRAHADRLRRVRVLASASEPEALADALGGARPDLLIIECPAVTAGIKAELARLMRAVGAPRALMVYGFARSAHLRALRVAQVSLMRAPVDLEELERHCVGLVAAPPAPAAPPDPAPGGGSPRRYSADELVRIASTSDALECECPRHLADLILSLEAFEDYSAGCAHRDARDAALHRRLHATAAASRALLEEALARVTDRGATDA